MRSYNFWVYILASRRNGTLYVGMTNDLERRISEHKQKEIKGFTDRYDVCLLVYYEHYKYVFDAIDREKELKKTLRSKKIELIEKENPSWFDLAADW